MCSAIQTVISSGLQVFCLSHAWIHWNPSLRLMTEILKGPHSTTYCLQAILRVASTKNYYNFDDVFFELSLDCTSRLNFPEKLKNGLLESFVKMTYILSSGQSEFCQTSVLNQFWNHLSVWVSFLWELASNLCHRMSYGSLQEFKMISSLNIFHLEFPILLNLFLYLCNEFLFVIRTGMKFEFFFQVINIKLCRWSSLKIGLLYSFVFMCFML